MSVNEEQEKREWYRNYSVCMRNSPSMIMAMENLIVKLMTRLLQWPLRAENINNNRHPRPSFGSKTCCSLPATWSGRARRNRLDFGKSCISSRPRPRAGPSMHAGIVLASILH